MKQYRKKPIIIEAIQFDGSKENIAEILSISWSIGLLSDSLIGIKTLEGLMNANLGDWIIKGVLGEVYPCKPDVFDITYEVV